MCVYHLVLPRKECLNFSIPFFGECGGFNFKFKFLGCAVTLKHTQTSPVWWFSTAILIILTFPTFSFPVTSAGLVSRLIWPGLLLASFTANLLCAGLYVYYQWGWVVGGSARAQSDSLSVPTVTLCPPGNSARLHQPLRLQFLLGDTFLSEEFLAYSEVWTWQLWLKQVGHENIFGSNYLYQFFVLGCTHTHTYTHTKVLLWHEIIKSCTDIVSETIMWNVQLWCRVNAARTLRRVLTT